MQNQGQVVIHIEGKYGVEPLTPDNYDISLMRDVLEYATAMLDLEKKKDRPVATFHVENGSVKNVITVSKQKLSKICKTEQFVFGYSFFGE